MKVIKIVLLSLLGSFFYCTFVAANWNTPGHDFNGGLKFEGSVTNNRNPWEWKIVGKTMVPALNGNKRDGENNWQVPIPSVTILSGKTSVTSPSGRQGLTPVIHFGRAGDGNRVEWTGPGVASVTLPVYGEEHEVDGIFTFKIRVAALMKHATDGKAEYYNLYNDTEGNGLPDIKNVIELNHLVGVLREIFIAEPLDWLSNDITVSQKMNVNAFSDKKFRQIDGAYGAQIVQNSGQLSFSSDAVPAKWRVTLPVSIEYQ